jgi:acyl carrier protein
MRATNIEQEIRTFLVDNYLFGRGAGLKDDDPLLGNVIDSTGVVEYVSFLQERFAITIEDDEVTTENLDSVRNSIAFIERRLGNLK